MELSFNPGIFHWLADLCLMGGGVGCTYLLITIFFVGRFAHKSDSSRCKQAPVTILKPLHGEEPDLLLRLATFCNQTYNGPSQIVFGCTDRGDGAIAAVEQLQRVRPDISIDLVVGGPAHGGNRKISNLINMAPAARHDLLVIADSDIDVGPDYLADIVTLLEEPGVGAVTCLYHGVAGDTLPASISALAINGHFLPNVLTATSLGLARPCFGATIALGRDTLERIGGFHAFVNRLADDHAIGEAVRAAGHRVAISSFSVGHACTEQTFRECFERQLRYARTIKSISPIGYVGAIVVNPLPLAVIGAFGGNASAPLLVAAAIACRLMLCRVTERVLRLPHQPYWLLPVTDMALFGVFVSSFFGSGVTWRGHRYRLLSDGTLSPHPN